MDDIGRFGIAHEILRKSADFLRRIIAPVDGMGGVTLPCVCPHCNCFPLDDYIWWVSAGHGDGNNRNKKHCNWWCAACGGQYEWKASQRILVVQIGVNANEAKVFKAHATPLGLCDNLINALKLLANQQRDGDCPIGKASSQVCTIKVVKASRMAMLWTCVACVKAPDRLRSRSRISVRLSKRRPSGKEQMS